MQFAKWQIRIKKHGLGHTISWNYNVQVGHARSNIVAFLTEPDEIP